jgi:hypothetical protein
MADRFFDTSAFAKHYRAELGTAKVDAFLAETGSRHFISAVCGRLCKTPGIELFSICRDW